MLEGNTKGAILVVTYGRWHTTTYIGVVHNIYFLMKICLLILGLTWTSLLTVDSFGQSNDHVQESRYRPFRVLIISPDTAKIDNSLTPHIEQVESQFKTSFYKALREFEWKRNTGDEEDKEQIESIIKEAKWYETDVQRFRYYHMISFATFFDLQKAFQKYPWEHEGSLTCQIVNARDLETDDLGQLTEEYDFDYVIFFKDAQTKQFYYGFDLNIKTFLFSKADSKVIMEKTVSGEARENVCDLHGQNMLECLMINAASEVTSELFQVLDERQKK